MYFIPFLYTGNKSKHYPLNRLVAILVFLCCFTVPGALRSTAAGDDTVQAGTTYSNYFNRTQERNVTEPQWKKLTDDEHFGYKDEKEKAVKKPVKIEKNEKQGDSLLDKIFSAIFSKQGKYVVWAILFLILGYAVFKFVVGEKSFLFARTKKKVVADAVETTEEDLLEMNWEQKLNEMIQKGDLRYAIRYSYMWMLQLLQEKSLISYRIDKTNYEYAAELKDNFKQPFRQITRQYEYAWYGQYPVTEDAYNKFREEFTRIKMQIGAN